MLATAHEGLAARATVVDVDAFASRLGGGSYAGADVARDRARDAAAQASASDAAVAARPADPEARLAQAEATLTQALAPGGGPGAFAMAERFRRLWFEDAENGARAAVQLGASGWRVDAVLALCAFHAGRYREAYERAVPAVAGMKDHRDPSKDPVKDHWDGPNAAALLALFAEARQEGIAAAVRRKEDWPPQWLTDVNAAYAALARHPFGTDANVADHYDFLDFFGAESSQRVLDEGLRRFPASPRLHERLRARILRLQNPAALEADYAARLQADGAAPVLASFAGYAELVVAEAHRRVGSCDLALAAYGRALQLYDRYIAAGAADAGGDSIGGRDAADHFAAIALAGRSRVLLERGELEPALAAVEASFDRRQASAATQDGLGFTAVDTARMLLAKLREGHRDEQATRLDARLQRLDPALLEPPPYERAVGPARGGRRRGRPTRTHRPDAPERPDGWARLVDRAGRVGRAGLVAGAGFEPATYAL
jgi:tetratricopeptide (TPR) repeat protein